MKNEILKVKHVTQIHRYNKNTKFYSQVTTDAHVKIAILEICFETKTKQFVVGTFKNICTLEVHCWYTKDAFAGFVNKFWNKKYFKRYFCVGLLSLELKFYLEKCIPSSEM